MATPASSQVRLVAYVVFALIMLGLCVWALTAGGNLLVVGMTAVLAGVNVGAAVSIARRARRDRRRS
jgi:hypothetical protein